MAPSSRVVVTRLLVAIGTTAIAALTACGSDPSTDTSDGGTLDAGRPSSGDSGAATDGAVPAEDGPTPDAQISSDTSTPGDALSDADSTDAGSDGTTSNDAQPINDAASSNDSTTSTDATSSDATTSDATTSDATASADATAPVDAAVDASAGDGGLLSGATLLLSDSASNNVYLLSITGTVLGTYSSPASSVAGVTYDRRLRDGFWAVSSTTMGTIYKKTWAGVTTTRSTQHTWGGVKGLEYFNKGATAAQDYLACIVVNSNNIEGTVATLVSTGTDVYQGSFFKGGTFQSGYWGMSAVDATNTVTAWYSRATTGLLERWSFAGQDATVTPTPAIAGMRGLARTPAGDFYVADATTKKVFHLASDGAVLDSFATPGNAPAGLAYDPGL